MEKLPIHTQKLLDDTYMVYYETFSPNSYQKEFKIFRIARDGKSILCDTENFRKWDDSKKAYVDSLTGEILKKIDSSPNFI